MADTPANSYKGCDALSGPGLTLLFMLRPPGVDKKCRVLNQTKPNQTKPRCVLVCERALDPGLGGSIAHTGVADGNIFFFLAGSP